MNALDTPPDLEPARFTARGRDRRQAIGDLLASVTRMLVRAEDTALIRGAFEQALKRIVPVRTTRLRDPNSRWPGTSEESAGPESIALDVPGCAPAGRGVLEATFDPGERLGEWDFQILGLAAHVGALVLEIERTHLQLARAGLMKINPPASDGAAPLIGATPAMQELRDAIGRVAATDFTVLLEGESGVGKELVARQIHDLSRRRHGPFVALNCAALVETLLEAELFGIEERTATGVRGRRGKFEAADGGTLFLDEVSDLSPSAQAKLLRAIQDLAVERVGGNGARPVDIRIIAASNRRLFDLVQQRLFRPDLFYRLSGVDIRVPSLRERRPDILELVRYFLSRHRSKRSLKLSPEAVEALMAYEWPGNVRELERVVERLVALAEDDLIGLDDLPPLAGERFAAALGPSLERKDTLRTWARRYVRIVLQHHEGNRRHAARALGISYHTLKAYLRAPIEEEPAARGWVADSARNEAIAATTGVP
jgi:DNA-binding NtrC family response regulator